MASARATRCLRFAGCSCGPVPAAAAATARAKKLDRARDDLERLTRGLGSRHYPDAAAVQARLAAIARSRRVAALLGAEVGTDQAGKPTLAWWFDLDALAAEQATDGWYALLTNLDPAQADAAQVLARYKGQEVVERRYGAFKGPLAVAPMFLQSNRRIQAWSPSSAWPCWCSAWSSGRSGGPSPPLSGSTGCMPASRPNPPGG